VGAVERFGDLGEEVQIVVRMTLPGDPVPMADRSLGKFAVNVEGVSRAHRETDDPGVSMIQPDNRMYVRHAITMPESSPER
jgi:hypothetical protein